jgi:hypothetical protein
MKLHKSGESGGALLLVLLSCTIMGITLGSYLQYTSTQSKSIMRSQAWNAAIPVAEGGVEEALAHINDSAIGTNLALNGWTPSTNEFQKSGTNSGGRFVAHISTDTYPILTVSGYTKDGRTTNEFARTVRVTTSRWATGMKGIVTRGNVDMGGITEIDSFDSEDERYSTRGRYDAAKHKDGGYAASVNGNVNGATIYGTVGTGPTGSASGNVGSFTWLASNSGIQPGAYANDVNYAFPVVQSPFNGGAALPTPATITLTNFSYWSTMITTTNPPSTTPASPITTNLVGTFTTTNRPTGVAANLITTNTTPVHTKVNPTPGTYLNLTTHGAWNDYDLITSYTYPSVTYTYSMTASSSSTTTDYYNYVLTGERYQMNELRMSGGDKLLVLGTNVTLYVLNDFTMTGNSQVILAPGAYIKVFVAGDVSLAGNGLFNYTLDASHLALYGLPSTRNISISGNAAYTGIIYAPQAAITMNGGGNTVYDVVGAVVANTATMNGHFHFHYDERLGRSKILSKYSVASWREL